MSKVIKSLEAYNKAKAKAELLRKQANEIEKAADDFRLQHLRKVEYKQTSRYVFEIKTVTGRKLKVHFCDVYEGKKKIATVDGGIHQARFLVALGEL